MFWGAPGGQLGRLDVCSHLPAMRQHLLSLGSSRGSLLGNKNQRLVVLGMFRMQLKLSRLLNNEETQPEREERVHRQRHTLEYSDTDLKTSVVKNAWLSN